VPRKPSAKSIEKRAKDAKAVGAHGDGRNLSSVQRGIRDSVIFARHEQGWTQKRIAEEAGISERAVRDIVNERKALGAALLDHGPIENVQRMAAQFETTAVNAESLAMAVVEDQPAVALAAMGRAVQARRELANLLQASNRLPRDMGYLGDLLDIREVAEQMLNAIRDLREGKIDVAEVEQVFRRSLHVGEGNPCELPAGQS